MKKHFTLAVLCLFAFCIGLRAEIHSGTCGNSDNLNWTLDTETGKLVISGTGEMANYYSHPRAPWHQYENNITSVDLQDGVTSIGNYAFSSCSVLSSITIPNSVKSIGKYAFENCTGLTSITIPNSVTSIGDHVFDGCYNLESIVVEEGNTAYDSRSGCNALIETSTNTLIVGCKTTVIPNSVTCIGNYAFYKCTGLTSITIPNSVTSIGRDAFGICQGLTSITIPNSVGSIGYKAFHSCSGLTSVVSLADDAPSLGADAFSGIAGNAVLFIPNQKENDYKEKGWGHYFNIRMSPEVSLSEVIGIGKSQSAMASNTWYLVHSPRIDESEVSEDKFTSPGENFKNFGGFVSDMGTGENAQMTSSTITKELWRSIVLQSVDIKNSLIRFVPVNGKENTFNVQFGTGNWMKKSGETHITSTPHLYEASEFRFYLIDDNNLGRFGWNLIDGETLHIVDNNGAGNTVSLSGTGEVTGNSVANNVWQIYSIEDAQEIEINDGSKNEFHMGFNHEVQTLTYNRKLPNKKWNALYVPFEIPYSEISDEYDVAYFNDVHSCDNDNDGTVDELAMEIKKIANGTLEANYPYLIKAKEETYQDMRLVLSNSTLYATEEKSIELSSEHKTFEVSGIYKSMNNGAIIDDNDSKAGVPVLAISTSGVWQPIADNAWLNPFRLFLTITDRDGSPAEIEPAALSRINIRILDEDDATGIEETKPENSTTVVYDLTGRRVQRPTKGGIYIINGKKALY